MRLPDYGIAAGNAADCRARLHRAGATIAELATPLYGFKRGRMTFSRRPTELLRLWAKQLKS